MENPVGRQPFRMCPLRQLRAKRSVESSQLDLFAKVGQDFLLLPRRQACSRSKIPRPGPGQQAYVRCIQERKRCYLQPAGSVRTTDVGPWMCVSGESFAVWLTGTRVPMHNPIRLFLVWPNCRKNPIGLPLHGQDCQRAPADTRFLKTWTDFNWQLSRDARPRTYLPSAQRSADSRSECRGFPQHPS